MFGVPIDGPAWLFGDNKSVVMSSTLPHATLGKHWNVLSYHRVHEAIAAGIICFEHIPSNQNTSDFLTKSLPHYIAKDHVNPLLFWKGETKFDLCKVSGEYQNETDSRLTGPTGLTSDGQTATYVHFDLTQHKIL